MIVPLITAAPLALSSYPEIQQPSPGTLFDSRARGVAIDILHCSPIIYIYPSRVWPGVSTVDSNGSESVRAGTY